MLEELETGARLDGEIAAGMVRDEALELSDAGIGLNGLDVVEIASSLRIQLAVGIALEKLSVGRGRVQVSSLLEEAGLDHLV